MLDKIFSLANGRAALAAFAVLFVSSVVLALINPKNEIQKDLGCDYVATDSTFLYKIGRVKKMFERYDEPQFNRRHFAAHRRFILVHDLVYPLCYAIPSVILLAYFFPVLFPGRGGALRLMVLLPILAMLFDYAENFTMLNYLANYKQDSATPAGMLEVSRLLTAAKLSTLYLTLLILFGVGAWRLAQYREALVTGRAGPVG
jgi:hypothetical protein